MQMWLAPAPGPLLRSATLLEAGLQVSIIPIMHCHCYEGFCTCTSTPASRVLGEQSWLPRGMARSYDSLGVTWFECSSSKQSQAASLRTMLLLCVARGESFLSKEGCTAKQWEPSQTHVAQTALPLRLSRGQHEVPLI